MCFLTHLSKAAEKKKVGKKKPGVFSSSAPLVRSLSTTVHTQRRTLQCLPTRTNLKAPSDASPSFSLPLPLPHREEEKKKRREKEKRLVVEERETKPNPNRGRRRRRRRRNQTQPRRLRRRRRRRGGSPAKAHRSSACGELF